MNASLIKYHARRIDVPGEEPGALVHVLRGAVVRPAKPPAAVIARGEPIKRGEDHRGSGKWLNPRRSDGPSFTMK